MTNDPFPPKSLIAVIVPVLNEAAALATVLQSVQCGNQVEMIVVDGGSRDRTVAIAQSMGVRVIETVPGRATQMNQGAAAATGDILLFLHGDTRLPQGFDDQIRQTLAQPGVVAGAFELRIDGPQWGLRLVEWGVKWRSRLWQMPYGDQAIFLKKSVFEAMGGFADLPIMEDFELMGRLRQQGRVAIVPAAVITASRRWQKLGIFQTTLFNQFVILAYFCGVSPQQIAAWYRRR